MPVYLVMTTPYHGPSHLALDAKGRLSMPTRHRDALLAQDEGRLTITLHEHGCLMIYPRETWAVIAQQVANWPNSALDFKRMYLGNAMQVEMDPSGRVLVAPELRALVGIGKDAMLVGMGRYFELWDKATYDRRLEATKLLIKPAVVEEFVF